VRLDVHLAVNKVERASKQISASRATRKLEEETLRAEKNVLMLDRALLLSLLRHRVICF
jgi:hypothetical protein